MSVPVVVVLAAGRGKRFGGHTHKLEQRLGTSSVIGTTLRHVLASQLPMVVVATAAVAATVWRTVAATAAVATTTIGNWLASTWRRVCLLYTSPSPRD